MQSIIQDSQDILRGFKMTLDFNKLFSAFVGILLSILWLLIILAFGSAFKLIQITPFELINRFLISPRLGLCGMLRALSSSLKTVEWGEYAVLVVLVLGLLIIWSVVAGSITRMAAVEFAKREKPDLKHSLAFAMGKFWSFFCSPLMPILGILFFVACNVIGGLLGQIEFAGEIAVAVGFPLAILSGFIILFLGIVGIVGFFLMYPAISAEGSDAFDAISRSYSYVLSRPLHFLSLFVSIITCGIIMTFIASCGACLLMNTTYFTVGIGMGDKLDEIRAFITGLSGAKASIESLSPISMRIAALFFMLYIVAIKMIVGSMIIAFAGSVSTIAYLILRKDVDGTEMDDVFIEEDDDEVTDFIGADKVELNEGGVTTTETVVKDDASTEKSESPTPKEPEINKSVSGELEGPNTTDRSSDNNGSSHKKQE